ncbi:MAG TPA: MBL fold metallo-hydrolase [Thermoanaerobaculia bacterium]|jgi:pyrroloquinoline quinone biosynthesis protein B
MNSKHVRRLLALALAAAYAAAAPPAASTSRPTPEPPSARPPRVVALGTVQDAGLPQPGCTCERCAAARRDPARRRYVASLALVVPRSGHTWLIDATPDLPAQIDRIQTWRPHPQGRPDRAPVDGVLLTHAHIGHYLGLALFGFEAINTRELPVYASPRMGAFLRANGPWSQLVGKRNIALREFRPGEPFVLDAGVTVTPIAVPHRDEFTDTMAFLVRGPHRSLLYVPDTDGWASWPRPLPEVLRGVDVAILDGTFFSPDELPDRDLTKIRHPLITGTMDLLAPLVRAGRLRVLFTHLNHSNPALDPLGAARRAIEARGFGVLAEGDELSL